MNNIKNNSYIDIHAHLNFSAYDEDRDEVMLRAIGHNVSVINVGTMKATSELAVEIAHKVERGVYAIVGLHPIHVHASYHDGDEIGAEGKAFTSKGEEFDYNFYKELASDPKVVGIGECGLDYFRVEGDPEQYKAKQKEVFEKQIQISLELNKPLMIHCRNAYDDCLEILEKYHKESGGKLKANFHFFAGSDAIIKRILDLGFTMSFTGVITFAREYHNLISSIPIERIMTETDCPYVTPIPYRGKRNEPLYVKEVVKKIAEIKGLGEGQASKILFENAVEFWNLSN